VGGVLQIAAVIGYSSGQYKITQVVQIVYNEVIIFEHIQVAFLSVTNFIQLYLYQFFNDSHGLNGTQKPLKRPFNQYQSCLEAINNGWDIRQINR